MQKTFENMQKKAMLNLRVENCDATARSNATVCFKQVTPCFVQANLHFIYFFFLYASFCLYAKVLNVFGFVKECRSRKGIQVV